MEYIDTHCHLDSILGQLGTTFPDFRSGFLPAEFAGCITISCDPGSIGATLSLLAEERVYGAFGLHPHDAKAYTPELESQLREAMRETKTLAWGEIGLDYHYDHSPRDVQQSVFHRQMELARAAKLPIIIHNRPSDNSENAWGDLFRLLNQHWKSSGIGGVLHCFTGEEHHARAALDMGFMISLAGNVTYPKAVNIQNAAKIVPLDRMFIETDSPYLGPIPFRGKRNEPAYVVETAKFIAKLRGISHEELGRTTSENFLRFFKLEKPASKKGA